jgi:hypothetical protein
MKDVKLEDISGKKIRNIGKVNLMNLKLTVKKKISEICVGASMSLRSCQSRTNIVKDEKGNLVTDCYSILARWRNHFSELLNVRVVNDVRQI